MKLTSPCLYSVTFFERWRAAATNPIRSKSAANCAGSGPVYSTNSNPSVPIGLSHRSLIAASRAAALDVVNTAASANDLQRAGDDFLHDFVGAAVDAGDAGVGVHAGDHEFVHVAIAAVELQELVDDMPLGLRGPQLGHRGGRHVERADQELLDAAVDKGAADRDLRRHLGELEAGVLEFGYAPAEGLALADIVEGRAKGALHRGQRADADHHALVGQIGHQLGKTLALGGAQ